MKVVVVLVVETVVYVQFVIFANFGYHHQFDLYLNVLVHLSHEADEAHLKERVHELQK